MTFADGTTALKSLDLTIEEGEFVVFVGPSGCGKSTALRILAGLEQATGGTVAIKGRDVTDLGPQQRDIAMVFQSYALYPHKSVYENLAYPLRIRGLDKGTIETAVAGVADLLGLTALLKRKPGALSGGQRQRVAMGRALVRNPEAFLMDEPLSNLDAALRVEMRGEIKRLHRRLGVTTVYVTHDQVEAM
ncbi:MAG: ABC transporter ATP-binding protein, partial [Mesorhizobium sp.]|nr:ABC transporter ATP-binding protein [Mesorhizobium sp.]